MVNITTGLEATANRWGNILFSLGEQATINNYLQHHLLCVGYMVGNECMWTHLYLSWMRKQPCEHTMKTHEEVWSYLHLREHCSQEDHGWQQHLHSRFCRSVWMGNKLKFVSYYRTHSKKSTFMYLVLCSSEKAKTRAARNAFVQLPAANSSIVINGKRIRESALPSTFRLFSGITWSCCRWHSASDQRTTALNKRTSRIPKVSLSSTATRVSARQDRQGQL